MRSVDQRLAGQLRALSKDPAYTEVLDWLRGSLEDTRKANDSLDGIELTRSQGKAQTLAMILRDLEASPETYEKFAKAQRARETNTLDNSTVE